MPEDADATLLNKLWVFTEDMVKVCLKEDGIGLHSCQTGGVYDLFIVNLKAMIPSIKENKFYRYFNCTYVPVDPTVEKIKSVEGCLSLNNGPERRFFEVLRFEKVVVKGKVLSKNLNNRIVANDVEFELWGLGAIVMQHEIDHSSGILIDQIGQEIHIY